MCFWKKKKKESAKSEEKKAIPVKEEVKAEPKPEPAPVKEEVKIDSKPNAAAQKKDEAPAKEKEEKVAAEVVKYHVSQNKDDKSEHYKRWRVRKSGSNKTIQYFDTQKEAIEFAKKLADNNDSSIVIHKVDGTMRKQKY